MKAKLLAVILVLALALSLMPGTVFAAGETGSGTEEDPFVVTTFAELQIAITNAPSPVYIKLGEDITDGTKTDVEIPNKTIYIDLDGKTLTSNASNVFLNANNGNLYIDDTSDTGNGKIICQAKGDGTGQYVFMNRSGYLNLKNIEIVVPSGCYGIYDGGNNATTSDFAAKHTIVIDGCDISGGGYGVNSRGYLEISGTTSLTGSIAAIKSNGFILIKDGSIVTLDGAGYSYICAGSSSESPEYDDRLTLQIGDKPTEGQKSDARLVLSEGTVFHVYGYGTLTDDPDDVAHNNDRTKVDVATVLNYGTIDNSGTVELGGNGTSNDLNTYQFINNGTINNAPNIDSVWTTLVSQDGVINLNVLNFNIPVSLEAAPTYVISIPRSVEFGRIDPSSTEIKALDFTVSVSDVTLNPGDMLKVSVISDFALGNGTALLPYKLFNSKLDGAVALTAGTQAVPTEFCTFYYQDDTVTMPSGMTAVSASEHTASVDGKITVNPSDLIYAGNYTDNMTFTVDYIAQ